MNHDHSVADEALQASIPSDSYYHPHTDAAHPGVDHGIGSGGMGSGTFAVPQDDDDDEDLETHTDREGGIISEQMAQIMRASGD